MSIDLMRKRLADGRANFIEPSQSDATKVSLSALPRRQASVRAHWIHEIKHHGFRLMARLDPIGIQLLARTANDGDPVPAVGYLLTQTAPGFVPAPWC